MGNRVFNEVRGKDVYAAPRPPFHIHPLCVELGHRVNQYKAWDNGSPSGHTITKASTESPAAAAVGLR